MNNRDSCLRSSRGSGLIVIIMIMAFLMIVGMVLMTITGASKETAGNIRQYQEAFNAAEAGFDAAWTQISANLNGGGWGDFSGHYLKTPANIDDPINTNTAFFRRQSDKQILAAVDAATNGVVFYQQPLGGDQRFTYTAFLIDKAFMTGGANAKEALLVLIGCFRSTAAGNPILATSRIEIEIALQ